MQGKVARAIEAFDRALAGAGANGTRGWFGRERRGPVLDTITSYAHAHPELEDQPWPEIFGAFIDQVEDALPGEMVASLRRRVQAGTGILQRAGLT